MSARTSQVRVGTATWGVATLEGRLLSLSTTPPQAGDRPWWAPFVGVLAIVPGVVALMTIAAIRMAMRMMSSRRSLLSGLLGVPRRGAEPLSIDLSELLKLWSKHPAAQEHSLLRMQTPTGTARYCRYAAAPSMLPLQVGDHVSCWGRELPDGTLRARRLVNRTTGTAHTARVAPPWVTAAALTSLVLCAMAFVDLFRI